MAAVLRQLWFILDVTSKSIAQSIIDASLFKVDFRLIAYFVNLSSVNMTY
ncbi:unnamed protein product [Toxocara canis]|uniref:Uncharacterized protein n=1 Tax=Toxocara canis TaxID=6265 RepID=A0A3P7HK14_TOXCA|nr:unnamed protein product [Toxocara canis]